MHLCVKLLNIFPYMGKIETVVTLSNIMHNAVQLVIVMPCDEQNVMDVVTVRTETK